MCLQIRLCTLLFMGFSVLKKSREMLVFLAGCSVPAVNQSYSTRLRWKQAQAKLHWMQLVHVLHLLFHSEDVFVYLAYIYSVLFSFWAKCGIPRTYSFRKKSFGTGSLNAIRKGWYIAAVIHKPCAKTFHIGNPFPLCQENTEKFQEEQL